MQAVCGLDDPGEPAGLSPRVHAGMNYSYYDLGQRKRGETIEVSLSAAANVFLVDNANYSSFGGAPSAISAVSLPTVAGPARRSRAMAIGGS